MKTWVRHACVVAIVVAAALPQLGATTRDRANERHLHADGHQALPLTCVQAWVVSGQSYPAMLAIVTTLAKVSLANRELTFPNTREAGIDAGRGIGQDCKADPRALLYAIVDKHVRRVAEAAP